MLRGGLRRWMPLVFALGFGLAFWSPAFVYWYQTGHGDWQQFQHQWEAGYTAIFRHGEFPLWNPHHCGGVFLFGDPQAQVYSPLFFLFLPLGTTLGLKLFVALHCAIGLWGMVVFIRREVGCVLPVALVSAIVWGCSGFFAWRGSGGHAAFLPFYFTPWLLLAWRGASRDVRHAVGVAAIMAVTLFEGGVYPFPYFCLLLTFDGVVRLCSERRRLALVRAGAIGVALMSLLGAFRLLPILDTMQRYPRPTAGDDAVNLAEALDMLTAADHAYRWNHEYLWAEYGAFVGWVALALAGVGVAVAVRQRRWGLLAGAALFGALMLGAGGPWLPWVWLHRLPVFDSLRVPSRFVVFFTFYLALLVAIGLQGIGRLVRRWGPPRQTRQLSLALSWLALLAIAGELAVANLPIVDRWRRSPLPRALMSDHDYEVLPIQEYRGYASFPARGVSSVGCYTGMVAYRSASGLWVGKSPQVRVGPLDGKVISEGRTANRLFATVDLKREAQVVFNQTFAEGWRSAAGEVAPDARGRISIRLPKGQRTVELVYQPPWFRTGAGLSLGGLLLALATVAWGTRRLRVALDRSLMGVRA